MLQVIYMIPRRSPNDIIPPRSPRTKLFVLSVCSLSYTPIPFVRRRADWPIHPSHLLRGCLLLTRPTHLVHAFLDPFAPVMHVLQCLFVLAVLRLQGQLGERDDGDPEGASDADEGASLHCDEQRLRSMSGVMYALLALEEYCVVRYVVEAVEERNRVVWSVNEE